MVGEGVDHGLALVRFERAEEIGGLVRLHLLDEARRRGGAQLLDDVGGGFGTHLVEDVCSGLDGVEVGKQLGCTLLVERFEDVRSVVGGLLGQLLPLDVVIVEVLLGRVGPPVGRARAASWLRGGSDGAGISWRAAYRPG